MNKINFKQATFKEWENIIPKKMSQFITALEISPFSHISKVSHFDLYKSKVEEHSWGILQSILINDSTSNEEILGALNTGANYLILNIKAPLSSNDWDAILKNVQTDLIQFHLQGNEESVQSFINYAENNNIDIKGSFSDVLFKQINQDFKFLFPLIKGNGTIENEIVEILSKCYKLFSESGPRKVKIALQVKDEFLHNISSIFAFKIAWVHFCEALDMNTNFPEIFTYNKVDSRDDFEAYCIKSTIHLSSSIAGGANGAFLQSPDFVGHERSFTTRIITNIHFLCLMEGKMSMVTNPIEGSYYIEEQSNHIAQKAWEKFQNSIAI